MKTIFNISQESFRLITNVCYSGFGQLVSLVSPLIITPYLLKVVGIEKFGLIVSIQGIMMYVSYLIDYSFNIDATQEASVNRNNPEYMTKLFSSVLWTKILLILISIPVTLVIMYSIPMIRNEKEIFLLSYTIVIGKAFMPQWLLVGTERIKDFTFFTLISKAITYIVIFLLVNHPCRYIYVNFLWGIGDILLLPIVYRQILIKVKISYVEKFSYEKVQHKLVNGWPVFVSNSMNGLYIYSNVTILSMFSTPYLVGVFAVAEKVMLLAKQIAGTVLQATYPHACKLASSSVNELKTFLKRESYFFVVSFSAIGIVIFTFADLIVFFFVGRHDEYTVALLRGLSFVPLVVSLNMPAVQQLLINGSRTKYAKIVVATAFVNVALNLCLVPSLGPTGTVIAIILTEVFSTVSVHYSLFKHFPEQQIFNFRRLASI